MDISQSVVVAASIVFWALVFCFSVKAACRKLLKGDVDHKKCKNKSVAALICGMFGCVLLGGGDWLMMYGNTA